MESRSTRTYLRDSYRRGSVHVMQAIAAVKPNAPTRRLLRVKFVRPVFCGNMQVDSIELSRVDDSVPFHCPYSVRVDYQLQIVIVSAEIGQRRFQTETPLSDCQLQWIVEDK